MNGTALGAESKIIFISEEHEKLRAVRYQDVYHKSLIYCLGICNGMPSVANYRKKMNS